MLQESSLRHDWLYMALDDGSSCFQSQSPTTGGIGGDSGTLTLAPAPASACWDQLGSSAQLLKNFTGN
jgi:hypothetical protein